MRHVTWSPDVVDRYRRRRKPPITSIGAFIVYLMNARFKNIPTERACLNALRTYTEHGRNIFNAAQFVIPYCADERLHHAKLCLIAIASPLSNPNAHVDIANMRHISELNSYVEKYTRIRDRSVVYRWVLAFTRPRHDLIKYIIQNTQPSRPRSSHVLHSPRNYRRMFRKKETRKQEDSGR